MYLIVLDANVWIRYARSKNILPLLDRMQQYHFLPVINNYLLGEVFDALVDNHWMTIPQASKIVEYIIRISLKTTETAVYRISPDPKDNYLFDLGVQNNCVFLISDDSKLLQFSLSPLPVHSTNWFLKQFPV